VVEETPNVFGSDWQSEARATIDNFEGLEFEVDKDVNFTFSVDGKYKSELAKKNTNMEKFFDQYTDSDGKWNHSLFNAHRSVVDNIESIVKLVYSKGKQDGQKMLVSETANASEQSPRSASGSESKSVQQSIQELFGNRQRKMTINI
jgi:hypothetical protein